MRRHVTRMSAVLACAAMATGVAACGKDDDDSGSGGGTGTSGGSQVKTGPGVSADKIRLGVLTDTSGVFAGLGKPLVEANRAFWKEQNKKGGVCQRRVTLSVKDHGYDPQRAVGLYREMEPDVLALNQLLGSPITAALLPTIQKDSMLSVLAAWPDQLTANPNIAVVGATYDIEMINGIDRLVEDGKIKDGAKLGHVYFEGEYGENALAGSKYYASKHGMKVVEQKIQATDTDMSAQVASLKRAKVDAILVTTGPAQMASLAGLAAAGGLDVPILGSGPTFDPALLKTPAAKALEKNVSISGGTAAFSTDQPGAQEAAEVYSRDYPKSEPKAAALAGYAESKLMYEVLAKACEDGALTREGVSKALRELDPIDTKGLIAGELDYSKLGVPPSRSTYISKVNPDEKGGLEVQGEAYESEDAKAYTPKAS